MQGAVAAAGPGHRTDVVDDGEHAARTRHAARLGKDGRRLRRRRQAATRQGAERGRVRRRLGLQLRRSPARRARTQRAPEEDLRQPRLGHELGRGRRRRRVPQRLLLLPAAPVQPLHAPVLPGSVPERCALQARGRRPGAARRGSLPGRAAVPTGLPVQEDLLQRGAQRQPALHRLLPAPRAGRGARLRAPVSRTRRVHRLPRRRQLHGLQAGREVEGGAAAAPRVRDAPERLLRAAAVAGAVT